MNNKENILELRKKGKSYNEISKILNISKGTISFHCVSMGINEPVNGIQQFVSIENIVKLNDFYKNHTIEETANEFKISRSTVIKYVDAKTVKLTENERKRRNYNSVKNRIQKLKQMAVEYLGGKCMKCGYNKCIWVLEFHHRNPKEKEFAIGKYFSRSWEKLKKELDKCDLLCANCHREKHFNEQN
jgi:DNA-binding CsgD family transcriptional regulator